MAAYQVYLPKRQGADPELLRAVGLGGILDQDATVNSCPIDRGGPDGGGGVLFFWGDTVPGVRLPSQEWTPAKEHGKLPAGRYWLGKEKNSPPHPAELLRENHLGGAPVTLDDGNEWIVPIAQRLPHRVTLDAEGKPVRAPKRQYEEFYRRAVGFYQQIMAFDVDSGAEVRLEGAWPFAVEALSMNYRVDAAVIDWLELLDEVNIVRLIGATFELGVMMEIQSQKKTA